MKNEAKIESDNIKFIEISKTLIDEYLNMINDIEVSKFLTFKSRCFSYENELTWIEEKLKNKNVIFSMLEKHTNEFIGNIELMSIENKIGELAICITPNKQNKGYGYESINRFINYCLDELHLNGIILSVYSHNKKAIDLDKRLGFKEYKVEKQIGLYGGKYVDDIYMRFSN